MKKQEKEYTKEEEEGKEVVEEEVGGEEGEGEGEEEHGNFLTSPEGKKLEMEGGPGQAYWAGTNKRPVILHVQKATEMLNNSRYVNNYSVDIMTEQVNLTMSVSTRVHLGFKRKQIRDMHRKRH